MYRLTVPPRVGRDLWNQVVLSGFSVRLFCFVQANTLCRYGCMYFFAALMLVCVYVMVMLSA